MLTMIAELDNDDYLGCVPMKYFYDEQEGVEYALLIEGLPGQYLKLAKGIDLYNPFFSSDRGHWGP